MCMVICVGFCSTGMAFRWRVTLGSLTRTHFYPHMLVGQQHRSLSTLLIITSQHERIDSRFHIKWVFRMHRVNHKFYIGTTSALE